MSHFDLSSKNKQIEDYDKQTLEPDFWQDQKKAQQVIRAKNALKDIVEDYMPHIDIAAAKQRAAKCKLPFPAFKVDGNKSEYFVNIADVAVWLDSLQQESQRNWSEVN